MSVTSEKPTIMQQPSATAPMTFTNNAPPAANAAPAGQPRDWSTGVCGCLDGDFGGFCLSCWCPCIVYSQYKSRLDHLKATGRAMPPEQVETFGTPGVLWLALNCCAGFAWILDFMARDEIRKRYNIRGDGITDCLTSCCCLPCAQRQHHRELLVEEQHQWGADTNGMQQHAPTLDQHYPATQEPAQQQQYTTHPPPPTN
ncbi:hypothetical protein JCM10049v2_007778 [Rhodotorula toruloides]